MSPVILLLLFVNRRRGSRVVKCERFGKQHNANRRSVDLLLWPTPRASKYFPFNPITYSWLVQLFCQNFESNRFRKSLWQTYSVHCNVSYFNVLINTVVTSTVIHWHVSTLIVGSAPLARWWTTLTTYTVSLVSWCERFDNVVCCLMLILKKSFRRLNWVQIVICHRYSPTFRNFKLSAEKLMKSLVIFKSHRNTVNLETDTNNINNICNNLIHLVRINTTYKKNTLIKTLTICYTHTHT